MWYKLFAILFAVILGAAVVGCEEEAEREIATPQGEVETETEVEPGLFDEPEIERETTATTPEGDKITTETERNLETGEIEEQETTIER